MTDTMRGDARVGAMCGAVAAAVATVAAAPIAMLHQGGLGASTLPGPVALLGLVAVFGAYGLLYVGWWAVPIGVVLGSFVGVVVGRRLMTLAGLIATMLIGAAAVMAIWVLPRGVDDVGMVVGAGALPGALGGGAAWWLGRRITRRRDRASGGGTGGADRASGEDGG